MIYNFKITSQESENFILKLELDGKSTFFDLHSAIQKFTGIERYNLASFFLSETGGVKAREISMLDVGVNGGAYFIMQKTALSELVKSTGQKLLYTYDFINDRSFIIELTEIDMVKNLEEPLIVQKKGDSPLQVLNEKKDHHSSANVQEEEVFMDFGILDDYNELFGEMEDF